MRIFEATDCYPPPVVGGRDLHVQRLARELARRGHEVDAISLAGRGGPQTERDGMVRVHRLAGWSRFIRYADPDKPFHPTVPDPGVVRGLAALLRERRPQIVHAHSWLLYSMLPLLPSPETRLVVHAHDPGFVCAKTTYVYRGGVCTGPRYAKCVACSSKQYGVPRALALTTGLMAMRPWHRRVDRYVAVSRAMAEASAVLLGRGGGTMEVIPPFVPDEAFHAAEGPRPAFVPPEGDYLMFAGTLSRHKGLEILLDAWAGLRTRPPLILVGIRRFDSPRSFPAGVSVVENIPHGDVLRAWGHCLAGVVPSIWPEPAANTALEPMAAGRPVVVSAIGGLPELVVDGTTGVHVPPGDVAALRSALERIIADPSLGARLGAAGRERARANYSADVVVGAWERVFHDVIDERARGPEAPRRR